MNSANYTQYTVKFNTSDIQELYSDWDWLVSPQDLQEPFLMNSFGDLLYKLPNGNINFLDTLEGTVTKFADTEDEAKAKLNDAANQNQYLFSENVDLLVERDKVLKTDELYIYVPHPMLTGSAALDSVQIMSMKVVLSLTGQLLRQMRP